MSSLSWTALTFAKLSVVLLGLFNLALMFTGRPLKPRTPSTTEPRQLRIQNHPSLQIQHLDTHIRPRTLFTEETVHYPVNGTLAELEWASAVPAANHGLVLLGPDGDVRPYAVAMFHSLHCLDRIRRAIVSPPSVPGHRESGRSVQPRYHVRHCFNYLRQMVLCAANTRLNPTNHVLPSGKLASDGIGLTYQCRDWDAVYEAFEANQALNRTISRYAG